MGSVRLEDESEKHRERVREGTLKQSCAYRKSNPDIFVMQSAEDRAAKIRPALFMVRDRGASFQGQVRARLIIVESGKISESGADAPRLR